MDRLSSCVELHLALNRPPFHPKAALLARLLQTAGAVFVVVNPLQPWTSGVANAIKWINLPAALASGSLIEEFAVCGIAFVLSLLAILLAIASVERTRKTLPIPGLVLQALRALIGVLFGENWDGGEKKLTNRHEHLI
jgi:hypothetical protein